MLQREIPDNNEKLPVIGLGTWQTFDVPLSSEMQPLENVLRTMESGGARLIDSSPMYGRSEEVIGKLTQASGFHGHFFYATKVWIEGKQQGIRQMDDSYRKMKRSTMDLVQIHNLVDWETHLETLNEWKSQGKVRYTGITHYTDSMHDELVRVISKVKVDFVQFNYSLFSRNAEIRLLPAAAEHGVATLINRPLGEGRMFEKVRSRPLPGWAKDYDIKSWGQFFLKFIVANPAVTCVIPGTGNPTHMNDNIQAGEGAMPDESALKKMIAWADSL
jgi:diketogulonate reductase-like aldo/keto reductase